MTRPYALTLFLSAALLFAVQPMLGKMLLPLVGGAPNGWLVALAFFQILLLLGYVLAHLAARLAPHRQALGALGLMALGLIMLPLGFGAAAHISLSGPLGVLLLLTGAASLPYLALSTISSSLQRLYAAHHGTEPYFLYAASNAGSLLGLLSYPFIVEPLLSLGKQSQAWTAGYLVAMALIAWLLWQTRTEAEPMVTAAPSPPVSNRRKAEWVLLAFLPASMSLGLTALLSWRFGSLPLLWIIPLALYLLTFILAFSRPAQTASGRIWGPQLLLTGGLGFLFLDAAGKHVPDTLAFFLLLILFFILALWCHRQLAFLRPPTTDLTGYYVWLALGGALGGSFNAFVIPRIPVYPGEFVVAAVVTLFLLPAHPPVWLEGHRNKLTFFAIPLVIVAGYLLGRQSIWGYALAGFVLLHFMLLGFFPRRFAAVSLCLLVVLAGATLASANNQIYRNFFGVATVVDNRDPADGEIHRFLSTGIGIQGSQRLTPEPGIEPPLYFKPLNGFLEHHPEYVDIGMIGIGAGMALCFTAPDRHFTVYEIDPKFRHIAETQFTYLSSCGAPTWRMGDGRIELTRDSSRRYDALIIDAFQDMNTPVHLITREAMALYRARLKPEGVLLYNLNNAHYDLYPQVAAQAAEVGAQAWRAPNTWLLVAPGEMDLSWLLPLGWVPEARRAESVWRDDFSNVLSVWARY